MSQRVLLGLCLTAVLGLAGCATADADYLETEAGTTSDSLTASYPAGSTARVVSTANFRPCASTASRCSPYGQVRSGVVVTMVTGVPSAGFYEVTVPSAVGGHTQGWIHGNLLALVMRGPATMTPGTMPTGTTAGDLVAATQSCALVSGAPWYAMDSGGRASVPVCQTGNAVWYRADLDVDCDGGSSAVCRADPDYQPDTSGNTSSGAPLDASTMNFVVVPLPSSGFDFSTVGVRIGTVAAVVYNGRVAYGIVGDMGPRGVVGEASAHLAEQLGINSSPTRGGVDSGVTYLFFPHIQVTRNEDQAEAQRLAEEQVRLLLGR